MQQAGYASLLNKCDTFLNMKPTPEYSREDTESKPNPLPAPNNGPSNTTPGPADTEDSLAIQELMKPLQVADLKTWIDSHNISTTLKNKKGTCFIFEHVL